MDVINKYTVSLLRAAMGGENGLSIAHRTVHPRTSAVLPSPKYRAFQSSVLARIAPSAPAQRTTCTNCTSRWAAALNQWLAPASPKVPLTAHPSRPAPSPSPSPPLRRRCNPPRASHSSALVPHRSRYPARTKPRKQRTQPPTLVTCGVTRTAAARRADGWAANLLAGPDRRVIRNAATTPPGFFFPRDAPA